MDKSEQWVDRSRDTRETSVGDQKDSALRREIFFHAKLRNGYDGEHFATPGLH